MDKISRRILADNIDRMVKKRAGTSVRAWAMSAGLDVRQIARITRQEHACTVDTLDEIAQAIGCQPWQLLVPNMTPENLPLLVMTPVERELYNKIHALIKESSGQ
jgi:hypothetical protein